MALASNQIRHLRGLAHHLHPLVIVGKIGLSEALVLEVARCLDDHELIKVRLEVSDRKERAAMAEELAAAAKATLVQTIGMIAVLYRAAEKPEIALPAPKRKTPADA